MPVFAESPDTGRIGRIAEVLRIQAETLGRIDLPLFTAALGAFKHGRALDIGTGEGSFLAKLAAGNPKIYFVGIEPHPILFSLADARIKQSAMQNVEARQQEFNASFSERVDVAFSRFTLQHIRQPEEFLKSVYRVLKPGGLYYCIEPVYEFYRCHPPENAWDEFRRRMLHTYTRWESHPNLPLQICELLAKCGFEKIQAAIHMYSPTTLGPEPFTNLVQATAAMLHGEHPDIWDAGFLETLRQWLSVLKGDPFLSIAHITARPLE